MNKVGRLRTRNVNEKHLLFVSECLAKAEKKTEIIEKIREKFKVSKKTAQNIYEEGLAFVNSITITNANEYKAILLERLEEQYRQTYSIDDISKRLQRQKEIIDSMAKISGVLNSKVNMINIFEHFPDAENRAVNITEKSREVEDRTDVIEADAILEE